MSWARQSGRWAARTARKSLPWLGMRRWRSSWAITKSWKPGSWSGRSEARVIVPAVEHEPHYRTPTAPGNPRDSRRIRSAARPRRGRNRARVPGRREGGGGGDRARGRRSRSRPPPGLLPKASLDHRPAGFEGLRRRFGSTSSRQPQRRRRRPSLPRVGGVRRTTGPRGSADVVGAPVGEVGGEDGAEEFAVVGDAEVEEFVGDHEVLEAGELVGEVGGEGDRSGGRA